MKSIIVIAVVCSFAIVAEAIRGGEDVKQGEIPYQIQLRVGTRGGTGMNLCSGALVAVGRSKKQVVLTAADCLDGVWKPEEIRLIAGEVKVSDITGVEQTRNVSRAILHPGFTGREMDNNIAILIPNKKFKLNRDVATISLPNRGRQTTGNVKVAGWGFFNDQEKMADVLQQTETPVLPTERCAEIYDIRTVGPNQICAGRPEYGHVGNCFAFGDKGAPLKALDGNYLAGIASYSQGCGYMADMPGVYTRVSAYLDWICDNVGVKC